MALPPPPPRVTGRIGEDLVTLVQWMGAFYKASVLEKAFIQTAGQFDPGTFDPASLPKPASTTIAKAQDTANQAYILAVAAQAQIFGEITVSDADPDATHTFAEDQPDTDYSVVLTAKSKTGTPVTGAYEIVRQVYTVTGFTITVEAAPGVGSSVTFVWHLRR